MKGNLLTRTIRKSSAMAPGDKLECIHCHKHCSPGMHYTGTVIDRSYFISKSDVESVNGKLIDTSQRIGVVKRKRGLICSDCAGIWRTVRIGHTDHPIVKTDPLPSLFTDSSMEDRKKVVRSVLNTTRTQ
jgi:hypothetical protein